MSHNLTQFNKRWLKYKLELEKAKLAKEQAEAEYYQARSAFIDAQIGNTQADTDLKAP